MVVDAPLLLSAAEMSTTVPAFTFVITYVRPEFTSAVMIGYQTQSAEITRLRWYGYVGGAAEQEG